MDKELIDKLKNIGLSGYESQVYVSLVKSDVMSAEEISKKSNVPKGRVYDVLNSLSEKSIIRSNRERPKKYSAVEPEKAINNLLEIRKKELKQKEKEYIENAETAKEIFSNLNKEKQKKNFWTSEVHDENAKELLLERISTAQNRLLFCISSINSSPEIQKLFVDSIKTLLEKNVEVKMIAKKEINFIEDIENKLIPKGMKVKRKNKPPNQNFIVIDSYEACIEILNPANKSQMLSVINFRNEEIVNELESVFTSIWNSEE